MESFDYFWGNINLGTQWRIFVHSLLISLFLLQSSLFSLVDRLKLKDRRIDLHASGSSIWHLTLIRLTAFYPVACGWPEAWAAQDNLRMLQAQAQEWDQGGPACRVIFFVVCKKRPSRGLLCLLEQNFSFAACTRGHVFLIIRSLTDMLRSTLLIITANSHLRWRSSIWLRTSWAPTTSTCWCPVVSSAHVCR